MQSFGTAPPWSPSHPQTLHEHLQSPHHLTVSLGRALSGTMNSEQLSPSARCAQRGVDHPSLDCPPPTPRSSPGRGWHRRACRGRWARAWEHHGARWSASGRKATRRPMHPSAESARPLAAPLRSASLSASLPKRSSMSAMAARSAASAWPTRACFMAGTQRIRQCRKDRHKNLLCFCDLVSACARRAPPPSVCARPLGCASLAEFGGAGPTGLGPVSGGRLQLPGNLTPLIPALRRQT